MNVKITTELHDQLCKYNFKEYLFGSQLHGIATEESDFDYIRVIPDTFYDQIHTEAKYLPNIHSWQYDDKENNTQYVWTTETQFYRNLFSGDGNMIADVVLLSDDWGQMESIFFCRTYKIIKGFLGVGKRDLKLHGNVEKKRFHAYRSFMMAEMLMAKRLPTVNDIQNLKAKFLPSKDELLNKEQKLRDELNHLLNEGLVDLYPHFIETNDLVRVMVGANNVKEFKY